MKKVLDPSMVMRGSLFLMNSRRYFEKNLGFVVRDQVCMNRNFDMAQLMTRLTTIMSVMKVFEDNPEWKQTRTRYLVDRLKPPGYKGDCKVKNIKLGAVWRQCINEAEKILAKHPNIGTQGSIGIFDQLFSEGATLLKPKGRSLQKEVDEERDVSLVVEEVLETTVRGNSSSEVPEGHVWESFLQIADGPDRSAAYVKLNDGSTVHMAPYINKGFNGNLEHDSTEQLRRVRGEGRCPGPRVAPPPADAVVPGTPFATLVTYNSPSKGKCTSVGVFSLLKCTLEGTTIAHPSAMGLKHTQGAKLSGEFLSFSRPNAEVALQWSGRFGPTIDVDAASTTFVDLDITSCASSQLLFASPMFRQFSCLCFC